MEEPACQQLAPGSTSTEHNHLLSHLPLSSRSPRLAGGSTGHMNPRPIISVVVGACFAVTTGYLTILGCSGSTPGATVPRAVCLESSGGWSVVASFVFPTFASLFLLNRTRRSGASKELPLGAKQLMVIGALSAVMAAAAFGGVQALVTPSIQSDPNFSLIHSLSSFFHSSSPSVWQEWPPSATSFAGCLMDGKSLPGRWRLASSRALWGSICLWDQEVGLIAHLMGRLLSSTASVPPSSTRRTFRSTTMPTPSISPSGRLLATFFWCWCLEWPEKSTGKGRQRGSRLHLQNLHRPLPPFNTTRTLQPAWSIRLHAHRV